MSPHQIRIHSPRIMTSLSEVRVEVRDGAGRKLEIWSHIQSATELVVQLGQKPKMGHVPFYPRMEKRGRKRDGHRTGPDPDPALRRRNLRAIARYQRGDSLSQIARESGCSPSTLYEAMQRTALREGIAFLANSPKPPRPRSREVPNVQNIRVLTVEEIVTLMLQVLESEEFKNDLYTSVAELLEQGKGSASGALHIVGSEFRDLLLAAAPANMLEQSMNVMLHTIAFAAINCAAWKVLEELKEQREAQEAN
jgi:transposase-like protein